jgi:hypothetical protein
MDRFFEADAEFLMEFSEECGRRSLAGLNVAAG